MKYHWSDKFVSVLPAYFIAWFERIGKINCIWQVVFHLWSLVMAMKWQVWPSWQRLYFAMICYFPFPFFFYYSLWEVANSFSMAKHELVTELKWNIQMKWIGWPPPISCTLADERKLVSSLPSWKYTNMVTQHIWGLSFLEATLFWKCFLARDCWSNCHGLFLSRQLCRSHSSSMVIEALLCAVWSMMHSTE